MYLDSELIILDQLYKYLIFMSQIYIIKLFQVKIKHNKEREVDATPESLIYVEGVEAQAFFNFLMNCKSAVAASGPLTGVPPTLLAPVAFQGATLKPLKVTFTFQD